MINILLPNLIYAKIFAKLIPDKFAANIKYKQASLLSKDLANESADIALIPSFDLLTHPNFYISERYGISCDGLLSTANVFYNSYNKEIETFHLFGDVTSNEVLLPKVLFLEKLSKKVNVTLSSSPPIVGEKDFIIVGDINFNGEYFNKGVSFAEDVTELLNFPYVNYVLASKDDNLLKEFIEAIELYDTDIELILNAVLDELNVSDTIKTFIIENFFSLYFEITESERFGLEEMLKLPYYNGLVDDMVEISFV